MKLWQVGLYETYESVSKAIVWEDKEVSIITEVWNFRVDTKEREFITQKIYHLDLNDIKDIKNRHAGKSWSRLYYKNYPLRQSMKDSEIFYEQKYDEKSITYPSNKDPEFSFSIDPNRQVELSESHTLIGKLAQTFQVITVAFDIITLPVFVCEFIYALSNLGKN